MDSLLPGLLLFVSLAAQAAPAINPRCLSGTTMKTKQVTHYMIPLLDAYNKGVCDTMEGTCIYQKQNISYLHNYGYPDLPLAQERCKNGYGDQRNCLHPCRTLAASSKYHHYGQIVFIKDLVGRKCGNLKRDGFEMIHDGFMMIGDTGSPKYFHAPGRFDFFWGRCKDMHSGECLEGAIPISDSITDTPFCTVWDPRHPNVNRDIKEQFDRVVRAEDLSRGDTGAAAEMN